MSFFKRKIKFGEIEVSDAMVYGGEHEARKIEEPIGLGSLKRFLFVIFTVIVLLFIRSFYLTIVKGDYYREKAERNRISKRVIKAPRGIIEDSGGQPLVKNIASFDAVIIPSLLPANDIDQKLIIEECYAKIKFTRDGELIKKPDLSEINFIEDKPYLIKENLSEEENIALELAQRNCPGFETEKSAVREYSNSVDLAHVLGYVGKVSPDDLADDPTYLMTDSVGKLGVEETWEQELRGLHGYKSLEVDSRGQVVREIEEVPSMAGNRIRLGIDQKFQDYIVDQAIKQMQEFGTTENLEIKKASIVAIDPRNGLVRALVNIPSYDNNLFSGKLDSEEYKRLLEDKDKPFLNRAIAGTYPPGSTIKPLIATAALEEGIVSEDTSFNCSGSISVGVWRFGDWKTHGSNIDIKKAIAQSCDVYFYTVGGGYGDFVGLGVDRIKDYCEKFNLGNRMGIDLPGEVAGFIPTPEWKLEYKEEPWYIGNTYHISIGQGDLNTTPLQIAAYISAIANGGTLYEPHMVDKVLDAREDKVIKEIEPKIVKDNIAKSDNLRIVREGMRQTVVSGTARMLQELETERGVEAAGKTGTAQVGGTENTHSWFVGFAPYDNPEIVIAVLVEEGGESTDTAVPIAKEALKYYFKQD